VARVRAATAEADALVAVGSGTINDLCKYAAFLDRKPYVVFGTAPSMNGYTSVSAAITEHGHKKSLPAAAPVGVFLDLAVLAAAPPRMIRSGLGDSICRPPPRRIGCWRICCWARATAGRPSCCWRPMRRRCYPRPARSWPGIPAPWSCWREPWYCPASA
jgi:Glycerol dehydrogenase and related enzymes